MHAYRGGAWRYLSLWVCTAILSSEELNPLPFLYCSILLCTLQADPLKHSHTCAAWYFNLLAHLREQQFEGKDRSVRHSLMY
jgi:hypothetical protein